MPLKSLHLTNSWHENSGGIATFYRALIGEANRRGHLIRLVVPGEKDKVEECGALGRIYHIQAPRSLVNSSYRTIYPIQFLRAGSKLQSILASERPDLVEVCDKYTLNYLAALLRFGGLNSVKFRPLVVGLSCERMNDNVRAYVGKLPLARSFCSLYMKWLYFPFFDHHIANSQYTADELRSAAQGHLITRGTWIRPMGVNLDHLSPNRRTGMARRQLLQSLGAPEESVLLLYVGRLVPEKNLALLFDLLAYLVATSVRDFRLLVAGDGVERKHWEAETRQRVPGHVAFLGHVSDSTVLANLYANADLFIHPNPREPFGIGPLEAMASGIPLIAPNSGGITSYATTENAWLVDPNVTSFSAAVEEALSNEALRVARVSEARQTAKQYDWKIVASSFMDLYCELKRAAEAKEEPRFPPVFRSTAAVGSQSVLMRSLSATAERSFQLVSKVCFEAQRTA